MARLLTAGAETGSALSEGYTVTGVAPTFVTSPTPRSGARALSCTAAGSGSYATFAVTTALTTVYYARVAFRIPVFDGSNGNGEILAFRSGGGTILTSIYTDGGNLRLDALVSGSSVGNSGNASVAQDTWHVAELGMSLGVGSIDYLEARLDGVSFYSSSSLNITDTAWGNISFGTSASQTVYIDDIALNDNSGGSSASWPGLGKVVLLVPTADSAKGTGWVGGAGGTTNEFEAMNNIPPVGVADTGTNASQNRNATSAANSNLDMTMTTYTAAGIVDTDAVNVVVPVVVTAAPVVTSAKQGTVGVVSNPAITNVALGAGGTAGAFWSGVAGGTYPTGWKTSRGTTTYAPSVTLGTAPVMRLTQVTASTRIAMVCFMGIYVEYSTPSVPPLPRRHPMVQLLAH